MSKFGVIIRRKRLNEAGYPMVLPEEDIKRRGGYKSDQDYIIKLGLTEGEANEIFTQVSGGLIDLANGLHGVQFMSMKEIVNKLFFGGE